MRRYTFCTIIFIFVLSVAFTDIARARPDSHAPIGVMGEHGHKVGEMMLAYRFMTMDMRGLQSGTDAVETVDVLKDFMMAPTAMNMKVHLFGVMFAPHDKVTLIGDDKLSATLHGDGGRTYPCSRTSQSPYGHT